MRHNLILTGDINLLGVTDPTIPFAHVRDRLHAADVVFANLEGCFYEPEGERSPEDEGFYAPLKAAEALTIAGVHAVGNANNVNYGAPAIRSSLARLDELGILHTGAGVNIVEARKPAILERDGVRLDSSSAPQSTGPTDTRLRQTIQASQRSRLIRPIGPRSSSSEH